MADPQRTGLERQEWLGRGSQTPGDMCLSFLLARLGVRGPHIPPQKQVQAPSCNPFSDTSLARLMTGASCSQHSAEVGGRGKTSEGHREGEGQQSSQGEVEGVRSELQIGAIPEPKRITDTRQKKRSAKAEEEKQNKTKQEDCSRHVH